MPMILPPVYLDVPAIIQPAAQSSAAHASFGAASRNAHPGMPIIRPQGFSSGPDLVPPPNPGAQPQGGTGGPDATRSSSSSSGASLRPPAAD
jgi:hypothetical protein